MSQKNHSNSWGFYNQWYSRGNNRIVKVQSFPGATVDDMYHHIIPIIRKKHSHLIIHIGTNDARNSNSRQILKKVLSLKSFILETLPDVKSYLSTLVLPTDDEKVILTNKQLREHILDSRTDIFGNKNIDNRGRSPWGLYFWYR